MKAGASFGMPALIPTTRAMYISSAAVWMTLPNTTCSTCSGSSPARSIAARAAVAPSCAGGTSRRLFPNDPMAVRAADAITTSVMVVLPFGCAPNPAGQAGLRDEGRVPRYADCAPDTSVGQYGAGRAQSRRARPLALARASRRPAASAGRCWTASRSSHASPTTSTYGASSSISRSSSRCDLVVISNTSGASAPRLTSRERHGSTDVVSGVQRARFGRGAVRRLGARPRGAGRGNSASPIRRLR